MWHPIIIVALLLSFLLLNYEYSIIINVIDYDNNNSNDVIIITLGELQLSFGNTAPSNSSIVCQICRSKLGKLGSGFINEVFCYIKIVHLT